ncbi:MAG TPA: prepilin-type N-terminal cleavage/methylation domain-containing protein [Chthoniobacterales bacterium]|jgi:type II secretory pathway pseudopilin PulG
MTLSARRSAAGFTLVEMVVAMGVSLLVGLMIFLVFNTAMVLYAKNTAINSAHQQARTGIEQMLTNIHSSVSIPELVDTNLNAVAETDSSGNPTNAAGVSFQTFNAGPFPVVVNAAATATSITLYCPGYTPPTGARLNIPSHDIEYDVTSSSLVGSYRQFSLDTPSGGIGTAVTISGTGIEGGTGVTYIITAFITTRQSYAVVGSELRYYSTNDTSSYSVIARNLTAATPFTVPLLGGGGMQNRFISAVNLSSLEPNYTNRGFSAVNMFISSLIPFRSRLTNSQ